MTAGKKKNTITLVGVRRTNTKKIKEDQGLTATPMGSISDPRKTKILKRKTDL